MKKYLYTPDVLHNCKPLINQRKTFTRIRVWKVPNFKLVTWIFLSLYIYITPGLYPLFSCDCQNKRITSCEEWNRLAVMFWREYSSTFMALALPMVYDSISPTKPVSGFSDKSVTIKKEGKVNVILEKMTKTPATENTIYSIIISRSSNFKRCFTYENVIIPFPPQIRV